MTAPQKLNVIPLRHGLEIEPEAVADLETLYYGLADNTQRNYLGCWQRYAKAGYTADAHSLVEWINKAIGDMLAPGTISLMAIAVRKYCYAIDLPIAGKKNDLVTAALKKARRMNAFASKGSVPGVDWDVMERAVEIAREKAVEIKANPKTHPITRRSTDFVTARDIAILGIGRDTLLRVSNLRDLMVEDFEIRADGIGLLRIRKTKTDQFYRGTIKQLRPETVKDVLAWLKISGHDSGPLFLAWQTRRERIPLTVVTIRNAIKNRLIDAGAPDNVSAHSLRHGSAQSLARRKASLPEIMHSGSWENPAQCLRYISGELDSATVRYS